jgi:hypothetical protein
MGLPLVVSIPLNARSMKPLSFRTTLELLVTLRLVESTELPSAMETYSS